MVVVAPYTAVTEQRTDGLVQAKSQVILKAK